MTVYTQNFDISHMARHIKRALTLSFLSLTGLVGIGAAQGITTDPAQDLTLTTNPIPEQTTDVLDDAVVEQAYQWIRQRPKDDLDVPLVGYSHDDLYWTLFSLEYAKRADYTVEISPNTLASADLNFNLNMLYNMVQHRGELSNQLNWSKEALYTPAEANYWQQVVDPDMTIKTLFLRFLSYNVLTGSCYTSPQSQNDPAQVYNDCIYLAKDGEFTEHLTQFDHSHEQQKLSSLTTEQLDQLFIGRPGNSHDSDRLVFCHSKLKAGDNDIGQIAWAYYNTPEGRAWTEQKLAMAPGTLINSWILTNQQYVDSLNQIIRMQSQSTNQSYIHQLADGSMSREAVMTQFLLQLS